MGFSMPPTVKNWPKNPTETLCILFVDSKQKCKNSAPAVISQTHFKITGEHNTKKYPVPSAAVFEELCLTPVYKDQNKKGETSRNDDPDPKDC